MTNRVATAEAHHLDHDGGARRGYAPVLLPQQRPGVYADTEGEQRRWRHFFAHAVTRAGGGAGRLDASNKLTIWDPLEHALPAGHSFSVEPRGDLLALDLDAPRLITASEELVEWLTSQGYGHVRCLSGGTTDGVPRQHLWVVLPLDATSRSVVLQRIRECGLGGGPLRYRCATRPPLAPHRAGHPVALLDPANPEDALAILTRGASRVAGLTPRPLSARMEHLLRHGDTEGWYKTGTHMTTALANAFVGAGRTCGEFVTALLDPTNKGGEKARDVQRRAKAARDWEDWLDQRWVAALENVHNQRDAGVDVVMAKLDTIDAQMDDHPWSPRTAVTDRSVLLALLAVARQAKRLEFDVDQRRLAELSGRTRVTVSKSLARLAAQGRCAISARGADGACSRYRLHESVTSMPRTPSHVGGSTSLGIGMSHLHDVWARGALGPTAESVYRALLGDGGWFTAAEVKARTSPPLSRRTVHRQLDRLLGVELVVHELRTWRAVDVTDEKLDSIAAAFGTAGRRERIRRRHGEERRANHERLERRAAARAAAKSEEAA